MATLPTFFESSSSAEFGQTILRQINLKAAAALDLTFSDTAVPAPDSLASGAAKGRPWKLAGRVVGSAGERGHHRHKRRYADTFHPGARRYFSPEANRPGTRLPR
jgi:hypothetical protein